MADMLFILNDNSFAVNPLFYSLVGSNAESSEAFRKSFSGFCILSE